MKAKEAGEYVKIHPDTPCFFVDGNMIIDAIKMIPEYPNPLHRRQWIHGFLKALPEELRPRFEDLKK